MKQVVVSQSPLRDRDGVVLKSNLSAIVQHGNAIGVMVSCEERLLSETHVILAETIDRSIKVQLSRVMPKTELAFAGEEVGTANPAIIVHSFQNRHFEKTSGPTIASMCVKIASTGRTGTSFTKG